MEEQTKWEGKITAKLPATTASEAWSLLSDFCDVHKWLPSLSTCRLDAGVNGQLGCVRYCNTDSGEPAFWVKEELVSYDPVAHSYGYKITGNNMGFGEYLSTLTLVPDGDGGNGCRIEWTYEADPVVGWTEEALVGYLTSGAEGMARRVEDALKVGEQN